MSEQFSFSADAGVIARLGRELVGRQETALTELVKNAYDADATEVDVLLEAQGPRPSALVITDNGTGMTKEELVRGFLRIASNAKVEQPRSTIFGRKRAGRKGIGRFATERLGSRLELVTHVAADAPGLKLTINWDDFVAGLELSSVQVRIEDVPPEARGTSLRIEGLRDGWTDAQLRRCLLNLSGILQPFPVAPVAGDRRADPGFDVRVWTPALKQEVFRDFLTRSVQVLPCVRPVDAAVQTPLACMEIAGRVQTGFARSRRSDISLVFPTPSSDRCAIPLV